MPRLRRLRGRPDPGEVRPRAVGCGGQVRLRGDGHQATVDAGVQRRNISPEGKNAIIAWLNTTHEEQNVGGMTLGNLGPVSEGMSIWVFGLAIMIGCAVWLGQKAA